MKMKIFILNKSLSNYKIKGVNNYDKYINQWKNNISFIQKSFF